MKALNREELVKLGYKSEYLDLLEDVNFSHVRLQFEDISKLESFVGKKVKLIGKGFKDGAWYEQEFVKQVESVNANVLGCSVVFKGGCITLDRDRLRRSEIIN